MTNEQLAALDWAATQGVWHLYQHFAAPDFTRADIVGQTRDDDIVENVNEPAAALIVALVNAYRAKQVVIIGPDAVEEATLAACRSYMGESFDKQKTPAAYVMVSVMIKAALAALGMK